MRFKTRIAAMLVLATSLTLTLVTGAQAQRQMEGLGRGVVALNQGDGKVFVSWRMLGTDPQDIAFNLYRTVGSGAPVKLNAKPLTGPTNYVDTDTKLTQATSYFVRPILKGKEQSASKPFSFAANAPALPYLSVPLKTPEGYTPNDASVADLDGDGEYEIVLHQTGRAKDNSQSGVTDPPILQAYKLDGTLLWSINLGRNIREGAHYTQFLAYDFDGDGRAEVVCKTADGTTDGQGTVIGDANANYVNEGGYILKGPEFLTVFDGKTGKALATTKYIPGRHPDTENPTGDQLKEVWGDGYGNRCDRFLACVAYLDGVHPSIVMCRGYYTRTVLAAWDWRGGKLTSRWVFDTRSNPDLKPFAGQGNHNLSVADVDGDGKDEIVYGHMCVDDNGKGLYTTGIGHGDAIHLSDLDPSNPGLEVFSIQERFDDAGAHMYDAKTGKILWKKASTVAATSGGDKGEGPGRGLALDIDPRYPGFESWAAGAGLGGKMWDAKGNQISDKTPSVNFGIYWDGDLLSELLDKNKITKWDYLNGKADVILDGEPFQCVSNNGTKATPTLSADILGDWREEVIWRTEDGKELRIFTTSIPTEHRFYTFMHDPQYRLSVAWQNTGYNQPPHVGFYIGPGMKPAPRPNIKLVPARPAPVAAPPKGETVRKAMNDVKAMTTDCAQTPTPATPAVFDVWPEGKMPGKGAAEAETEVKRGDNYHRITNVSRPTLTLFPTDKKDNPAPAMIVCPGGGYSYVVSDKEGSEIAAWLNSAGITALVLKYRNPNNRAGALQDIQRALSLTRAHAAEWNIDPKRLGVIGFSAGGHLSAKASTQFDQRSYPALDATDQQSCRPDFAVLVYPAYLDDKNGHVSSDLNLKAKIPPTLIVHSEDDKSFIAGSKLYHAALDEAKHPNEFLLYPTGGHGYGLHCEREAKAWPDAALVWMRKNGN
jgi:rhamnogalacturonan endolyase